ncbi:MAG: T9SS type A sorting domain-containing protein [Phaeodactylibacter xiamenensis]|nr:T9SS type A sorting domain-containing protein [Phaeodactylibacter xiamenensis]MCR9051903.1 T9SS type A sorting domain-containing protein [bacterium]
MQTRILLLLTALGLHHLLNAQCGPPENMSDLFGNEIQARITTGGDLFWDGNDARFRITSTPGMPSTIFAEGLWLGGIDPAGNLKVSAQTYGRASGESDYFPGPLPSGGAIDADACANWDRTWSVRRYEIEAHLADFADNGTVDTPQPAILEWPGKGNPYFEEAFGFPLPNDEHGLAPFADTDGDGLYDPMAGDYPALEEVAVTPEQMIWSVFNDAGDVHGQTLGNPLNMEIQRTSWAVSCGGSILDRTVFVQYQLINRGVELLDSLRFAIWTDFDLGCYTDDYVGSAPEYNAFFVYNDNPIDQNPCPQGVDSFGENPPVQSSVILSHPLSSYILFTGGNGPPGTSNPGQPTSYYHYMNGRWLDDTPITVGGNGYMSSTEETTFMFPDDPNDPEGWSLYSEQLMGRDWRGVGGVRLGSLSPNESVTVATARLYTRVPGNDFLENVSAMYGELDALHEAYANGFEDACPQQPLCTNDCVWPGDANADGIANQEDLLAIGLNATTTGPTRDGGLFWGPKVADDWSTDLVKHADTDGNGSIDTADVEVTHLNYNLRRPDYVESPTYVEGPELQVGPAFPNGFNGVNAGSIVLTRISLADVSELKGLSFSIEFDTRYFDGTIHPATISGSSEELYARMPLNEEGLIGFARYKMAPGTLIEGTGTYELFTMQVREYFDIPVPSDTSYLRFRDIVAVREDGSLIPIGGMTVPVIFNGVFVDTEDVPAQEQLQVFPNPTTGQLHVNFPGQQVEQLEVWNSTGQAVRRAQGPFHEQHTLDLSGLPAGLYTLRARMATGMRVEKVVVQP